MNRKMPIEPLEVRCVRCGEHGSVARMALDGRDVCYYCRLEDELRKREVGLPDTGGTP